MVENEWDLAKVTEVYKQRHEQEKKAKEAEEARVK